MSQTVIFFSLLETKFSHKPYIVIKKRRGRTIDSMENPVNFCYNLISVVCIFLVPIKSNSTALEWTENAETPFKLNWEIGCESDYINPVTVTISSNKYV